MTQPPATPYDGFLTVLAPQIDAARARLGVGIAALPGGGPALPNAPALVEMMFDGVRGHLERMVAPTLALELNVARLQGDLDGDTPEARYDSYVRQLAEAPVVEALRAEYPALFALAAERLNLWFSVSLELLERLAADWSDIRATLFDGRDPGALAGLRYPQRSTKRVGRAVVLMRFEGGDRSTGDRLVYKPRSLAVESRFHDLLAWLNGAGFAPQFRPVALLERDTHGWMAWVDAAEATTTAEIERFYRRQGAYLALFYALEATDLHMSNVIAAGEHPALIDLETLFHPREADMDWPPLDLELDDMIYYSVLRPGLLPEPETAEEGDPDRLDLSGLAGAGGQTTPYEVPVWRGKGTDAMRLEQARKTISSSKNQPMLDGQPADVLDYLDALEEGFVDAYRLLVARRDELMTGPLAAFAGVEVRVMPRSGRRYGDILEGSYHPDLLRDPKKRPLYLAAMLHDDAGDESDPLRLIDHELADILAGDTPIFTTQPGSADIADSRGRVLPRFFGRSGLDAARLRVAGLDERDLARQRWIVRASLATVAEERPAVRRKPAVAKAPPPDLQARALDAARAIGERLAEWAVRLGDEASWIGLEQDEYGYWSIEPMEDELAHGLAGAVAFLSALSEATGDDEPGELARGALATLLRHGAEDGEDDEYEDVDDDYDYEEDDDNYDDDDDYDDPLGLFDGVGGRLYILAHLHATRPTPAIAAEMHRLIALAADLLANPVDEEQGGLARGAAGALLGLLAAHRALPGSDALDAARAAGDLLSAGELLFEDPEGPPGGPLATFYDGALGALGPLLALTEIAGERRYLATVKRLVAGFADARRDDPGLWLAYLAARPWLGDTARRKLDGALREALPGVLARGVGRDHSLVYGDLGLVDLALRAAGALDDVALAGLARRYGAAVLDDIERRGPVAATPLAVETPGWAAGLAGIGYGLLRLAAPERVAPLPAFGPDEGAR